MYQLKLEKAYSKRGADLGRADTFERIGDPNPPLFAVVTDDERQFPYRFHLTRVRLDSGGYDAGGAYWGIEWSGKYYTFHPLYCAEYEDDEVAIRLFVRPTIYSHFAGMDEWRNHAKHLVRKQFPNARFYR